MFQTTNQLRIINHQLAIDGAIAIPPSPKLRIGPMHLCEVPNCGYYQGKGIFQSEAERNHPKRLLLILL